MNTPNTDSHFHLAQFAVDDGYLYVPLSSIASITYVEDDDQWWVNTLDGAEHAINDPAGNGIHSITRDLVTWQIRASEGADQAIAEVLKRLQAEAAAS